MLSCSCTLFNQKETFQLQNYTVTCCQSLCSSRKETPSCYQRQKIQPRKKASKRKLSTDVKTADPQPSTSKDESASTQSTQAETVIEQQPKDTPIAEQQREGKTGLTQQAQDNSTSTLQSQDESVPEQWQQHASDTLTFSEDSTSPLPDYSEDLKLFTTKDPRSIPKKPRYSSKPNWFNQLCLIFCYRSLKKYMSHILRNFCQNFRFSVIYSLKCLLLSRFSTNQTHLSYFSFFSSHFLFHTNLNLVHVLILVSSFHSSSTVLTVHFF